MRSTRRLRGLMRWSTLVLINCGLRTEWNRRKFHNAVSILRTWSTCWRPKGKRSPTLLLPTRYTSRNLLKLRAICTRRGTSWIWLRLGCSTVGGDWHSSIHSNTWRSSRRTGRRARRIKAIRKRKEKLQEKLSGKEITKDLNKPEWAAKFPSLIDKSRR